MVAAAAAVLAEKVEKVESDVADKVDKEKCTGRHLVLDEKATTMGHNISTVLRILQGEPGDPNCPGLVGGFLLLQQNVGNVTAQFKVLLDEHHSSRIADLENEVRHLNKSQVFPWLKVLLAIFGISSSVMVLTAALLTLLMKVFFMHSAST